LFTIQAFESQSDLLSQRMACPRELVAASEGLGFQMDHFSSDVQLLRALPSSQPPLASLSDPAGKEGLAAATECALDFLRSEAQRQQTEIEH
jgi:hypothetical protein